MKIRIEISNADTGEKLDIYEFGAGQSRLMVDMIRGRIFKFFGFGDIGSFGRGWNYSSDGYIRVDGRGRIQKVYSDTPSHFAQWDVYVDELKVAERILLRRDAMKICDEMI